MAANEKGQRLQELIDKQIESKKAQIASLNTMIESISARQRDLNQEQELIEAKQDKISNKKQVIDKNYDLAQNNTSGYRIELYYTIATGIILLALIGFFGYKLWLRFSAEILNS
jgi:ABC-type phosphate transport system auxiliary subunit